MQFEHFSSGHLFDPGWELSCQVFFFAAIWCFGEPASFSFGFCHPFPWPFLLNSSVISRRTNLIVWPVRFSFFCFVGSTKPALGQATLSEGEKGRSSLTPPTVNKTRNVENFSTQYRPHTLHLASDILVEENKASRVTLKSLLKLCIILRTSLIS